MSSGFVSGGTSEEPIKRDPEWLKVQQELEAKRRQKLEEGKQEDGKSLYDVLQQNKTAKQEAFEESIRLKNQFRSLDEDEVDFLDSVLESTRAKEAAVQKETSEQLAIFRRQQEAAEKFDGVEAPETTTSAPTSEEQWSTTNRKRRREKDKVAGPGLKLRKMSSSTEDTDSVSRTSRLSTTAAVKPQINAENDTAKRLSEESVEVAKSASDNPTISLGLDAYGSDED